MRVTLAFIGALLFLPIVSAQSPTQPSQPAAASARQAYSVPRTPWGDPDLQGLWPSIDMQGTPYERPETFGARAVLSEEEIKARSERRAARAPGRPHTGANAAGRRVRRHSSWIRPTAGFRR